MPFLSAYNEPFEGSFDSRDRNNSREICAETVVTVAGINELKLSF